jgi:hypothetical protein
MVAPLLTSWEWAMITVKNAGKKTNKQRFMVNILDRLIIGLKVLTKLLPPVFIE